MPSLAELLGLAPTFAPWNSNLTDSSELANPSATPWWLQGIAPQLIAPLANPALTNVAPFPVPDAASGGWLGDVLTANEAAKSPQSGGILQGAVSDAGQDASLGDYAGIRATPDNDSITGGTLPQFMNASRGRAPQQGALNTSLFAPFPRLPHSDPLFPSTPTASNLLVPSSRAGGGAPPLPLFSTGAIADNPNAREEGGDSAVLSDASPSPWIANAQYANLRGRRSGRRASEREITPIEEIRWTLFHHNLHVLGELDPRNPLLFRYTEPDWVPSDRDNEQIRHEIARAQRQNALNEPHHNLPREFDAKFRACGLDPERFITYIPRDLHRFRPDGLHTGPFNWNSEWRQFFRERQDKELSDEEVLKQLLKMWGSAPWLKR